MPFVVLGHFDDIYFYKRSLGARLQNERVSAMKIYTSQLSLVRNLVRLHIFRFSIPALKLKYGQP